MIHAIASLRNLWDAARRAARGKRHRRAVAQTLMELESVVIDLERQLLDGSWCPGVPALHEIRDPKRRTIAAAPFKDRIVHQALSAVLAPLLEQPLIRHSYACRTGLGTHAALRQATAWARRHRYFVHLDVTKFFPTVDHAIVLSQLERHVRCAATLALCRRILSAGGVLSAGARRYFPGDDLFTPLTRAIGLPIGNLTSQHFANRYLSPVDHRAKDRLRVRAYLRYMDDMLLFGDERSQVLDQAHAIEEACWRQRLRLHPWQVRATREGINFLGFRILPDTIRVRRTSVARAEKRLQELAAQVRTGQAPMDTLTQSLRSTFAHWQHGNTWQLRERTLCRLGLHWPPDDPHAWREALDGNDDAGELG